MPAMPAMPAPFPRLACSLLCVLLCSSAAAEEPRPVPPEEPVPPAEPAAPAPSPPADAPAPVARPQPLITAPAPIERVNAIYPPGALTEHKEANVLLSARLDERGAVTEIRVLESGGAAFDEAALAALRRWRFSPALRDGVPFSARVKVPFRFALAGHTHDDPTRPVAPPPPDDHFVSTSESPEPPALKGAPAEKAGQFESSVRGKTPPSRATSDFVLEHDVLNAAPHQSAGDLLSAAPGVYIARPEGDAVAHQVFLRGFDAEHGQDIEFSVGNVPINQPAHIHGQGYADLNFIIPEVVRSLRVTEGVYDPRQGDFAVAGSVHFDLGVAERGFLSHTSYGSFNTFRQLVLWAPRGQPEETFTAASIRRSDGYGQSRGSVSGSGIAQYAFGNQSVRGVVQVSGYGARAGLAGVLRLDDIQSGRVGYYDSYDTPSATAQSALSMRFQASLSLEHRLSNGARTAFGLWLVYSQFRSRTNFTGYTERSIQQPEWVGRGDLIEQGNRDLGVGAKLSHRTRRYAPTSWLSGTFEAGLDLRLNLVDQEQNLLQQPQNQTWDRRVDASIKAADIGVWGDLDWRITRYLRLRGGLRADVLFYDVDDRLGNFTPGFQRQSYLVGFRRTALGVAFGPRVTLEAVPTRWLTLTASYGEGYRSPQPRQLQEGENAPFAKVRSVEGGAKVRLFGERLAVSAAGYATFLSTDLAFDPGEGRLEKIGPTTRAGVVGHILARPFPWALLSLSVTYVHAQLDAPPAATAGNPTPSYTPGQRLPYVPPVVVRADVGLDRALTRIKGHELAGRMGLGFTFLSPRPLPFDRYADPVSLLDLSAGLRYRFIELGFEVFNVVGARYAATEYSFVSDWGTSKTPSLVPARHISAGPPRTLMATLGLHF